MIVTTRDPKLPPTLDNLTLVTRAGLATRNSPQNNYPPEVAALFPIKAAISRHLNRIEREQTQVE